VEADASLLVEDLEQMGVAVYFRWLSVSC